MLTRFHQIPKGLESQYPSRSVQGRFRSVHDLCQNLRKLVGSWQEI